jgi:hypothetical protein
MRIAIASLIAVSLFSPSAFTAQARSGGAAGTPAIKACSLLSKELAMKVSGAANKAIFDLPPQEEPAGQSGSACNYADITLQIDAFTPASIDGMAQQKGKAWEAVAGVGDGAYFFGDRNFARLIGHVGGRTFTIELGVPFQSTAEKMKPNVIALANAIIPKLK